MFDFEALSQAIARQTVLCVGDLMLDEFVYGEVSRISPEAPAPVIAVQRSETMPVRRRRRCKSPPAGRPLRRPDRRREAARLSAAKQVPDRGRAVPRSRPPDDAQGALRLMTLHPLRADWEQPAQPTRAN